MVKGDGSLHEHADVLSDSAARAREEACGDPREGRRGSTEAVNEGFALMELCRDDDGTPTGFRTLHIDPGFEQLAGIDAASPFGNEAPDEYLEALHLAARVVDTGVPEELDVFFPPTGRGYARRVFPAGGDRFVVLFNESTVRMHAAREVRLNEATLKSFYDSVPLMMGIAELDGSTVIPIHGNQTTASFFGVSTESLRFMSAEELNKSAAIDKLWAHAYKAARDEGRPVQFEYEHPHGDGSVWICATVAFIELAPSGRPRFSFVAEDVTERRRAEQELRASEHRSTFMLQLNDRLRRLDDPTDIQTTACELLGEFLRANRVGYGEDLGDQEHVRVALDYVSGVERLDGVFRYEDFGSAMMTALREGRPFWTSDVVHDPRLLDAEKAAFASADIAAAITTPLMYGGRLAGNMFAHFATAHLWSEGEVALVVEVAARTWNAVARRRAEAKLEVSEQTHSLQAEILRSVRDSLWVSDSKQRITYWSDTAERTFGWSADEVIGRDTGEILKTIVADPHRDAAVATLMNTDDYQGEVVVLTKDGRRIPAEVSSRVVRGPDGSITRIVNTVRDITERLEAQERLHAELVRTQILQLVAQAAASATTLPELGAAVLGSLAASLGMRVGAVGVVDRDHDELRLVASVGLPREFLDAYRRLPLDPGSAVVVVRAACSNRIVRGADVRRTTGRNSILEGAGLDQRSAERNIAIPVSIGDEVFGTISFVFDGDGPLTDPEIQLLTAVAQVLGPPFQNARLFEARERLAALMDHSPTLAFMKDEDGRYVYLNKTYEDGFVHRDDWYGKTDLDFWPRESAELFRANDLRVLASGRAEQNLEDSFDLEGNRHAWLNYKFPFTDSEGRRYTGGIGIDATRMIEAQEALQASQEKYHGLIEEMNEGFAVCELVRDESGSAVGYRYLEVNDAFTELTGIDADEILGHQLGEVSAGSRDEWLAFYAGVVDGARPDRTEKRFEPLDRWFAAWAYPREGDRFAVMLDDITDRVEAERALRESETELREMKEQLELQMVERQNWLSGISHDLRTPLAAIRGYAELLSTEAELPEELRRQTNIILGQSKRIQDLISDMLLAFRIEGGQLPLDIKRTNLAEVLSNVEEVVGTDPRFIGRKVTFEVDPGRHFSQADYSHLSRAIVNLVVNALNHNPLDTSVVVSLSQVDGANQIRVVDTGEGIDDDTLSRVWERFSRGISSSQDTDGVGLGMATTRHLVELMQGEIGVTSQPGAGTTVTIRLPRD